MSLFNTADHFQLNFVHKRIGGALKGFVTSGFNPISAASGFISPPGRPSRPTLPETFTARPSLRGARGQELGRNLKFGGGARNMGVSRSLAVPSLPSFIPCVLPFRRDPDSGECRLFLGERVGPDGNGGGGVGGPPGEAVMGRYGAALVPGSRIIDRAECIRGMIVGDDGLCYNKSQIKNSERMWPKGRRPLLTGGDMAAISKAARAAGRLERTTKRLQKIGLMKKPSRPAARRVTSGSTDHHHHS